MLGRILIAHVKMCFYVLYSYTLASPEPEACIQQLQQLEGILHKCAINMNVNMNMNGYEYVYPF